MAKSDGPFRSYSLVWELLAVFIITIPCFMSILGSGYFTMHDDQQVARLFLLDQGIKQGNLYPRWVDWLGFNFGYPLFNFYPPFSYYVGELFHTVGFSYIWSIKLVFISGFIAGSWGVYVLAKHLWNRSAAMLSAILYSYFFYHATTAYVRGALAEFVSMAVLPYVLLAFHRLQEKRSVGRIIQFAVSLAILLLTHPLIAFPAIFFLGFYFLFLLFTTTRKQQFTVASALAGILGLALSAFFWLPSMIEKKFTLVDSILTTELASYKLHFVCPFQLWNSPWGYGGSIPGCFDGLTFQLGIVHIVLAVVGVLTLIAYVFRNKKLDAYTQVSIFILALLIFSIFMMLPASSVVWNAIQFLSYLQFPWRFFTFTGIFISLVGGMSVFYLNRIFTLKPYILAIGIVIIGAVVVWKYSHYFAPQSIIETTDADRTSFDEISWRISRTSFEFSPKGFPLKKSNLNTSIPTLEHGDISAKLYAIMGPAQVKPEEQKFSKKSFAVIASTPILFQLHTFYFPGWTATIDGKMVPIENNNRFKLSTIHVPSGTHEVMFEFRDTPIRSIANIISLASLGLIVILLLRQKFV